MKGSFVYNIREGVIKRKNQITSVFAPILILAIAVVAAVSYHPALGANLGSDFSQCSNSNPTSGSCNWIGSILQSSNSVYSEGMTVPQRLLFTGFSGSGSHTISFDYQYTKGGIHAYDFLTTVDPTTADPNTAQGNGSFSPGTTVLNPCADLHASDTTTCNTLAPTTSTNRYQFALPSDTYTSKDGSQSARESSYGGTFGTRYFNLYVNGKPLSGTPTVTLLHSVSNSADTGDSTVTVTISFDVSAGKCTTNSKCNFLLYFGGHLGVSGDGSGDTWGPGLGSSNISGGPYHIKDVAYDGSGGSQDNQIQGADILVAPDQPTVNTAIHTGDNHSTDVEGTTITLGATIHDQATVDNTGGSNDTPEGTVAFDFFNNKDCSGNPAATTNQADTLVNGVYDATNFEQGPLSPGNYSFLAHYTSSDTSKWSSADGNCETVSVGQAQLTVNTQVHDSNHNDVTNQNVTLGSILHDYAALTGAVNGFDTPLVSFTFYTQADCGGTGVAVDNTGTEGSGVRSTDSSPLTAGSYSYKASVSGDSNYLGDDSDCENFSVTKADLRISTAVYDANSEQQLSGNLSLGGGAYDTAAVTGKVGSITIPDVTFYFFDKGISCSDGSTTGGTQLNTITPDGTSGIASPSDSKLNLSAGTYNFMAVVAGDSNYNGATSACEPFTVDQATPSVVTEIHDSSENVVDTVSAGDSVHDQATVTGIDGFEPTGSVDFYFYSEGSCESEPVFAGAVQLSAGVAHPSDTQGPLSAGNYSFKAYYGGDSNYSAQYGDCESLAVATVSPSLVTTPTPSSGTTGDVLNDSADFSGGFNPTGKIAFNLYDPSDPTCSGTPIYTENVDVNGAGTYTTTTGYASTSGGTWRWLAVYSGDNNNNALKDTCDAEQMVLSAAPQVLGLTTGGDPSDPSSGTPKVLGATLADTGQATELPTILGIFALVTTLAVLWSRRFDKNQE